MSYIDKELQPGETVLGRTHLHWIIYGRALFGLLLSAGLIGLAYTLQWDLVASAGAAAISFITLLMWLRAWITVASTELVVTDRRVIHKVGFIARKTREMNREKVESIDVDQSIMGRLLGYGTIIVHGTGSSWEPFASIADPLGFRSLITAR